MGGVAHTRPGAILIVLLLWDPHLRLRKLLLQSKSKRCGVRIPQFPRRRICVRRQAATRATRRRHHMCCCAATATVTHGTRETSHGLARGRRHRARSSSHHAPPQPPAPAARGRRCRLQHSPGCCHTHAAGELQSAQADAALGRALGLHGRGVLHAYHQQQRPQQQSFGCRWRRGQ
jgi:hypothetical protein